MLFILIVQGILKGCDPLQNLVLDETFEYVRGIASMRWIYYYLDLTDGAVLTDELKELGLVVCRGTAVLLISPLNGTEEIANPFAAA